MMVMSASAQRSATLSSSSSSSDRDELRSAETTHAAILAPPPPPPPLPPPLRLGVTTTATDELPTPRSRLRRLQWVKIPAGRVSAAAGARTVWTHVGNNSASSSSSNAHPSKLDFAQMEELFRVTEPSASMNGVVQRQHGASLSHDVDRRDQIDLLDSKRSLNVNIFLRQFPQSLSTADIVNALLLSDPLQTDEVADGRRGCDAEMMSCLLKLAPDEDDDEVQRLVAFNGDRRRLGPAERFLTQLVSLPNYQLRIEASLLKEEFSNTVDCIRPCLDAVILTAKAIKESELLREIIYMILVAGNFLNTGGYAGNAAGFKLDSLLKLTDIRANKPNMNLLHYVAMQAEAQNPALLKLPQQFSYLKEAALYTSETLAANVAELSARVKMISSRIEQTADTQLQRQFHGFLETAADELRELQRDMSDVERLRSELALYFCDDEATFKLDDCIKTFSAFFASFAKAIEENGQRQQQQKQADERRRQREQQISARQSLLTVTAGVHRGQCTARRYWRPCWQDDEPIGSESAAGDVDITSLSPACSWNQSTSRCSSAAGTACTSSSSSVDPVEHSAQSSPALDEALFTAALPSQRQRRRASSCATEQREQCAAVELSPPTPSDDLLDVLQHRRVAGSQYDCSASAGGGGCFEGRVGSLRRRRRSTVTPELMQLDRERATASPTAACVSTLHQATDTTPEPPPPTTRRRLLPQPDRSVSVDSAPVTSSKDAELRRLVSSRHFMPISSEQEQQREGETHPARRLPLVVDTGVGRTLVATAEPQRDCRTLEAAARVTSDHQNQTTLCSTHEDSARRLHRQQSVDKSVDDSDDDDDDKLQDLPTDEQRGGQLPARLTFRSSTLPRRWKWHSPTGQTQNLVDSKDCREAWARQDVQRVTTEPQSPTSSSTDPTPTPAAQPHQSTSTLARVEAMKDRFRRLSEMYKNSQKEDDAAMMSTRTRKSQNTDVGKSIEDHQWTGDDRENTAGIEVDSKTTPACNKTAVTATASVTSDTESLSSCGRDEGFESETATGSVLGAADVSCESHQYTPDGVAEDTTTVCSEANLFASSIDSIIQQMCPRMLAAADASSSSSLGTPSTDEALRCRGVLAGNDDVSTSSPGAVSTRRSRLSHQRAFIERMSAPRRSVTNSPQRHTSTFSPSDTVPSTAAMFSSPAVRRRTRTPSASGPRDSMLLSVAGLQHRRSSDVTSGGGDEVCGSVSLSKFVRGSVARTSLPHTGISVRASSARPMQTKDQKQSALARTGPSTKQSHRSTGTRRVDQTSKPAASTGWYPAPAALHVDRNGVQMKSSSAVPRVFSTPVCYGATSHQTRASSEPQSGVDVSNVSVSNGARAPEARNQHTSEHAPPDSQPAAARVSERKSVFERLFEKAHRHRHSKTELNGAATAVATNSSRPHQAAVESHRKPPSKRSNSSSRRSNDSDF